MRFRATESLEADSGALKLRGTAVRYSETAGPPRLPFKERILPGAFTPLGDTRLNRQHERGRLLARTGAGLVLTDTPEALYFEADLPSTREAEDTVALVRSGVLRGSSIEYSPVRERMVGGVLVVEKARLSGLAIVDSGAYTSATVEARAKVQIRQNGEGLLATYVYGQQQVISSVGSVRKQSVSPGSLSFALNSADREVNVLLGRTYANIVGSKRGAPPSSGTRPKR